MEEEGVTNNGSMKINEREIVLDMLLEIIEGGKFSHTVLNHTLSKYQDLKKQERSLIARLATGTVERYITLDYRINQVASLPVNKMKPLIRNLLRLSVYQLLYMDNIPDSAVCNEAVKLAKKRKFVKLSGFVNAVLRGIIRTKDDFKLPNRDNNVVAYLSVVYSTPEWLVSNLLGQYDKDQVEKILSASLEVSKTSIRCNIIKVSPSQLKDELIQEGVSVLDSQYLDYGFYIYDYDHLEGIEAFKKGHFVVQDISSQLVSHVAGINSEDFVVDVCAAPGGKALHASQSANKVLARDLTEYKIDLINDNIKRLDITNVETEVWDASVLDTSLIGKADVVIADLPCSGIGVMGKKVDIKYKMTHFQQIELVELQRKILTTIQNYVKPGGTLIYSTCTINNDENIGNMNWFLQNFDFQAVSLASHLPEDLRNEDTNKGHLQLLQGVHGTDGFFISKMKKN